jgi:DNA-binding beta-propeller fold protein YncE
MTIRTRFTLVFLAALATTLNIACHVPARYLERSPYGETQEEYEADRETYERWEMLRRASSTFTPSASTKKTILKGSDNPTEQDAPPYSTVDAAINEIRRIFAPAVFNEPGPVTIRAAEPTPRVFLLNEFGTDSIMVSDANTGAHATTILLASTANDRIHATGIDVAKDASYAYITALGRYSSRYTITDPAQIVVVNLSSNSVAARIPLPPRTVPYELRLTPDGLSAWVVVDVRDAGDQNAIGSAVLIFDVNTRSFTATIPLPPTTFANRYAMEQIDFTPDGALAFVGTTRESPELELYAVDTATRTVIHTIISGFQRGQGFVRDFHHVGEFAIDRRGEFLYLAVGIESYPNPDRLGVRVYDISTMTLKRTLETSIEDPRRVSLALNSEETALLLAPWNKPDVARISLPSGRVSLIKIGEPRSEIFKVVALR